MSFPAIMVMLVFITGIIWLFDSLFWAKNRKKGQKQPVIVDYARSFFPVILLVLVIRSFLVEPFRIPSASMLPTLHIGDFILVNKFAYGIRLPVLNNEIIAVGRPERGDVFVFRYPNDPSIDYIKRVVGLPGDKIGYFNKTLYVNNKAIVHNLHEKDVRLLTVAPARSELYFEQLGDRRHAILIDPDRSSVEGEMIVPAGHYFAMGDNRDNSNDSRFWGTVPQENLVGKAFFIWMSWNWNAGGVVWSRLGNTIN